MLGVDAAWLPRPSRSRPILPGESIEAVLTLRPTEGTLPARYPVAIAVQALDPVSGQPTSGSTINQLDLIVDAPGQINISLDPVDTTAVFGKKLTVLLHNTGMRPEDVHLDVHAPNSAVVDLPRRPVQVPAGATLPVHGRLSVARPAFFRSRSRHSFVVTARSSGAPRFAEGSLTSRAIIGPIGGKVFAVVALLAVWVAVALIVIPGLANKVRKNEGAPAQTTTSSKAPNGGGNGKGGGKNGGGGNHTNGGGKNGGSGGKGGGGGNGGGATTVAALPVQLNGTVTGNAPSGVTVTLASVSLGSDQAVGATPVGGGATTQSAQVGKLPEAAFAADTTRSTVARRDVTTGTDGAWTFPKVPPIGYYLVTFAKPGYQTQRFIVNAASTVATQPLKVELVAGQGSLQGIVHNGTGRLVGAATVVINDGADTITTSTNSTGANIGHWSVSGLSTPATYVVSVSRAGLGTQTQLITLSASGTGSVNTTLQSGVSTLTGHVVDAARNGIGDVQITATNGADTRTASTVTTGTQKGTFTLPDLTVGRWSVTMQAAGYQVQSRTVRLIAGKPVAQINATLSIATATVDGVVRVQGTNRALVGAGLVLTNNDHTYKQMSITGGAFHFAGVAAGVYTLTAQFFGMDISSQSVTAVVGKHTHLAVFHLNPTVITNTSTIVGFVGNAVASGGSLGCQQADPPTDLTPQLGCIVGFRLTDSADRTVSITVTHGKPEPAPHKNVAPTGPTPYLAESASGLKPGLYKLTISSPGYLPATVSVRVPLDQVATAPQVNLFPANIISGQLDTIGNINTDGGNTAGNNCVVAVPGGYPITSFNIAGFTCSAAGTEIVPLQKQCNENGTPTPNYSPVADDGSYRITGLCDGRYSVYVIVGNPAYEQPALSQAADQTVVHGETVVYSPHVPRKGILALRVQEADPVTGVPATPTDKPILQLTGCGSAHGDVSDLATDANATAKVFGFAPGTATCTITSTAADSRPISGNTGSVQMTDDTTTAVTSVLSGGLAPMFGQVLTRLGATTSPTPVGGGHGDANSVTVHIHAITGYNGGVPTTSDDTIKTDANGCFAVVPSSFKGTVPVPTGCASTGVDPNSVLKMDLTSQSVSISIDAGTLTRALASQPVQLAPDTASPISVTAAPISITGTGFVSNVGLTNFNGATTTLLSKNALGSGSVSVGIAGDGQLTWLDSNIGTADLVWPGTYSVKVQVPGFSDQTGQLSCGQVAIGDPSYPASSCTLVPNTVSALGSLSGTVSSTLPLPGGGTNVNGATVIVRPCASAVSCSAAIPLQTSACPSTQSGDLTASTNSAGQYSFVGTQATFFMPVGTYDLFVCAAGLRTASVNGLNVASGPNSQDVSMDLLGGIHGTITRSGGSSDPVTGATVLLHCDTLTPTAACPADKTTTTDGAGQYQFSGSSGQYFMDVGTWKVTVTAPGYDPNDGTFTIGSGDNDASLTMNALGSFTGTVEGQTHAPPDDSSTPLPGATVKITCTSCSPNIVKVGTTDSSGQFAFIGTSTPYILKTGSWTMVIDAAGYQEQTYPVTINSGPNDSSTPFLIQSLGTVTGTIKGTLGTVTQNLAGANVTASFCGTVDHSSCPSTAGDPTTITDASGRYTFSSANSTFVLAPGWWQILADPFGYQQQTGFIQVERGSYTVDLSTTVRPVDQSVDIVVAGSSTPTKHAIVDFHPADTPATTIHTTLSGNDYVAAGLLPGSYNVSISGDASGVGQSIIPSSATLTVALSNTGTAGPVPLSVTVVQNRRHRHDRQGATGKAAALDALQGVSVELGTMSGSDVHPVHRCRRPTAQGTRRWPTARSRSPGSRLATYSVRIDHDPPIDGYDEPAVIVNGATVQFGFAQDLGTITLTRTQQQATLSFTGLPTGDDLTGATANLVNKRRPELAAARRRHRHRHDHLQHGAVRMLVAGPDAGQPALRHVLAHHGISH